MSGNFGVPNSKRAHFMVTIVKKRECHATPYVINEILRKFSGNLSLTHILVKQILVKQNFILYPQSIHI